MENRLGGIHNGASEVKVEQSRLVRRVAALEARCAELTRCFDDIMALCSISTDAPSRWKGDVERRMRFLEEARTIKDLPTPPTGHVRRQSR